MDVYWLEHKQADVPDENDWLSAREILRLDRLRFPKRRADWRLGRWTAKNAVASCMQMAGNSLAELEIRANPSGAPEVFLRRSPLPVTISLSHRDGIAACGLVPDIVQLGCDLEMVEPHGEAFLADYFTAEEHEIIRRGQDRDCVTAILWSAKESALKALGEGLRLDTRDVVVSLSDASREDWHALQVRHQSSGQIFEGWWSHSARVIRTVVGNPAPMPPVSLREHESLIVAHRGVTKTLIGCNSPVRAVNASSD